MRRNEAPVGEGGERVVDGLARDGAELGPHGRVDVVGGAVGQVGHRPQHRQALRGHVHPVLAEHRLRGLGRHGADPSHNFWI